MNCNESGVCQNIGCDDCPDKNKPKTMLAPGSNWPVPVAPKPPAKPSVPREKPLDTTLDYFKDARDFIAPRVKDKGTVQLVRLYRDTSGTIIGSEEVKPLPQAYVTGANPYSGTPSIWFNDGFRAAERLYGIGDRKKRVK